MNILIAIDFSAITSAVLATVSELVEASGDKNLHLHLMHVAEPDPEFVGWDTGPDVVQEQVAKEGRRAEEKLEGLATELRSATGAAVTTLFVRGPIAETVHSQAKELEARMIIVGSHGHGAAYNLVIGSISAAIVKESGVPVLIVPDPDNDRTGD